jgi:hypothetical protein
MILSNVEFYKYIYEYKGAEYIFYAASRGEADLAYKKIFGSSYKKFLRREDW